MKKQDYRHLLDMYETYLSGVQGVRASSSKTYILKLGKMFRHFENAGIAADRIDEEVLGAYLADLRGVAAVNTRRILVSCIRGFFAWYSKKYQLPDPSTAIRPIREYVKQADVLRLDDVERMIRAAGKEHFTQLRNSAIICVLADTGIRISELVNLRVSDVTMDENQFIMTVPPTKGNRSRYIPFCYQQEGALVAEIFSLYYMMIKYKRGYKPSDYMFQRDMVYYKKTGSGYIEGAERTWDPGPLSRKSVAVMLRSVAERAQVTRHVTPHSFRHFYATYLAVNGVEPIKIQQRLGHASLDRTMIYVHYADIVSKDSAKDNPLGHSKADFRGSVKAWKQVKELK